LSGTAAAAAILASPHLLDSLKLRGCHALPSVAKLVADGRHVADRRVQAHGVVVLDPVGNDVLGVG